MPEAEIEGGKMGKVCQKVQLPVIRQIIPDLCDVQHGDYSLPWCIVYLKVAKRADLESSHHKKKKV